MKPADNTPTKSLKLYLFDVSLDQWADIFRIFPTKSQRTLSWDVSTCSSSMSAVILAKVYMNSIIALIGYKNPKHLLRWGSLSSFLVPS